MSASQLSRKSSSIKSPKTSASSIPGLANETDANKMPLKGSLLSAIYNLLHVIETSESEIMIPTLLQDKCDEMDANQVLLGAKMIKASLMGYRDLIDFYMGRAVSTEKSHSSSSDVERFVGTNSSSSISASSISGRKVSTSLTNSRTRKVNSVASASSSGASSLAPSCSDEDENLNSLQSSQNSADDGFNSDGQSDLGSMSDDSGCDQNDSGMLQARKTVAQIENLRDSMVDLTLKLQNIIQVYKSSVETMAWLAYWWCATIMFVRVRVNHEPKLIQLPLSHSLSSAHLLSL